MEGRYFYNNNHFVRGNLCNILGGNTMIRILVEEEYGYRYWQWNIEEDSNEELEKYFNSVVDKGENEYWYCTGVPQDHFNGEWKELDWEEYRTRLECDEWDGCAHIHQNDDSHIGFKGELEFRMS